MTHTKKVIAKAFRPCLPPSSRLLFDSEKRNFFFHSKSQKKSPFEFIMTASTAAMIKAHWPTLIDYLGLGMNGINIRSL